MRKIGAKGVVMALAAVILLISLTVVAGAAATQLWYLDSDDHADVPRHKVMEKTIGAQSGEVTVAAGECIIWLAENAALVDVTFPDTSPGGAWVTQVCTDSDWGTDGDKCDVIVGEWDIATVAFVPFSTTTGGTVTWSGGEMILTVEVQTTAVTVDKDDYLALKICNESAEDRVIYTDGCSWLTSPCSDPGYPWPEIAAGVLFGIGLIGLLGYVGVRRVRANKAAA